MSALADHIGDHLARAVGAILRWRKIAIVALLAAAVLSVWYAAHNLGVNTDTANMISATLPWRQNFNEYREAFPVRDRNLLVVIDAKTPARADEFAAKLLAELRREPDVYRSIFLQGEGEFFARNGLLYLPRAQLEQLADRLTAAQPLLGLLHARLDGAAVLDVAARTLAPPGTAAAGDPGAATPLYAELARVLEEARSAAPEPLAWGNLLASGAAPASTRRIVVLQPAVDFGRIQPATAAIDGIRAIAERLNAAEPEPVTVRLSGSVAMEHEEFASVSTTAGLGSLATLLLVCVVLYVALRSWRLLAISVITLFAGLAYTAAFAAVTIGHLNLLSIAFVVLNVGLGSDYVIHVLLRHRELLAEGHACEPALLETMRGVGSSLVLCAVTTAAGFYAFIPTQFRGVAELGWIAGTGVFFGLLAATTLLPALVAQFASSLRVESARTLLDPRIFIPFTHRPRAVLSVTALVLAAALVSLPWLTFDSNPIHLRDQSTESVTTLLELAADGNAQMLNLEAVAPDHPTAADWAARLRGLREVRNVITVDSLVPADQNDKLAVLDDLKLVMGPSFAELERSAPDSARLSASLAVLDKESAGSVDAARLHSAAAALRAALAAAPPAEAERRLAALDAALTQGLAAELARLAAGLDAKAFGRDALPEAVASRFVATHGRELVEIIPAEDVSDNAAARRFIAAVHGVVGKATGLPVVYQEASSTVVHAFALALLYAFLMVSAIIFIVLRELRDTLLVIAPIALATLVTAALTVAIDMPFNYADIIALPLLVGFGVDNGIHVMHRLRTDTAEQLFDTSTMRAVLASALTTVASFGNLAFSSHVGTASMGVLLALGLAVSMAFTLIVLPAWLKLRAERATLAALIRGRGPRR
jgi:hopanoid biosynthesis associated RND transporter like protein HpnN